ncbi:MAG: pantetheine-phosphate adenylyltransferase [Candidatus Bruticola sp.]
MNNLKVRRAVYAGSFDPLTNGHLDIIGRAARSVDELIVAVVCNPNKNPLFSLEQRKEMISLSVAAWDNVKVDTFSGLLIDFVRHSQASFIVRGLRDGSDFAAEFKMALINRQLAPEIDTIFFISSPEHIFVSSSCVREIASLGGDISRMVPAAVSRYLAAKFNQLH